MTVTGANLMTVTGYSSKSTKVLSCMDIEILVGLFPCHTHSVCGYGLALYSDSFSVRDRYVMRLGMVEEQKLRFSCILLEGHATATGYN